MIYMHPWETLRRWVAAGTLSFAPCLLVPAAEQDTSALVTTYASETRNRAAVLLIGDLLTPDIATRLQAKWSDTASFFRPSEPVTDLTAASASLERWLEARTWHVAVLGFSAERLRVMDTPRPLAIRLPLWATMPSTPASSSTLTPTPMTTLPA